MLVRVVLFRENYTRVKSRLNEFCLESRVSDHKGSVLLTRLVDVERTNSILFDSTFCFSLFDICKINQISDCTSCL